VTVGELIEHLQAIHDPEENVPVLVDVPGGAFKATGFEMGNYFFPGEPRQLYAVIYAEA
jgi:hypothetical protein